MSVRLFTAPRRLCLPALVALGLAWPLRAPAQTEALQPLAEIAATAEAEVRALVASRGLAFTDIRASALDNRLRLKRCELPLESFSKDSSLRGGRVTVGVRCAGAAPWTLYVPVAIDAQLTIVVIAGPLPRGTILNASHLRLEQRSLSALPPQYLDNTEQVLGLVLTRAVSGDTIATPNMLQARDLVAAGQEVTILASGANIQVRMPGVALQKGQAGERIDVKNKSSGRTLQAVILDDRTVQVQL